MPTPMDLLSVQLIFPFEILPSFLQPVQNQLFSENSAQIDGPGISFIFGVSSILSMVAMELP